MHPSLQLKKECKWSTSYPSAGGEKQEPANVRPTVNPKLPICGTRARPLSRPNAGNATSAVRSGASGARVRAVAMWHVLPECCEGQAWSVLSVPVVGLLIRQNEKNDLTWLPVQL